MSKKRGWEKAKSRAEKAERLSRSEKLRAKTRQQNEQYETILAQNPEGNNRAPRNSGGTAAKRGKVNKFFKDIEKLNG